MIAIGLIVIENFDQNKPVQVWIIVGRILLFLSISNIRYLRSYGRKERIQNLTQTSKFNKNAWPIFLYLRLADKFVIVSRFFFVSI